jgi:Fe2+ or Zn2+ uptake regulation protein
LSIAVLKASTESLTVRDVHEKVKVFSEDVSLGTIANVGTKAFQNGIISRDDGRWQLIDRDKAGVIHDGFVWGPPQIFQMHELAAHRRAAILHVLRQNTVGLQVTQIVVQLRNDLVKPPIPVNKSLVKADLEALQDDGNVRRRGNSKKWEAV